ncbi:hypothetical protein DNTS_028432, partial [Danionella cerebrum]
MSTFVLRSLNQTQNAKRLLNDIKLELVWHKRIKFGMSAPIEKQDFSRRPPNVERSLLWSNLLW